MTSTNRLTVVFIVLLIGLSACTKEKKVERSLLKKEGVWNVENYHKTRYLNEVFQGEMTYYEHPAFVFSKGGDFEWENKAKGKWYNTDDEIVVVTDEGSVGGTNTEISVFRIIDMSKNEMTLERTRVIMDMGYWKEVDRFLMKRRK